MAVRFQVWVGPPATPLDVLLCETITQDVLLELAPAPPTAPHSAGPAPPHGNAPQALPSLPAPAETGIGSSPSASQALGVRAVGRAPGRGSDPDGLWPVGPGAGHLSAGSARPCSPLPSAQKTRSLTCRGCTCWSRFSRRSLWSRCRMNTCHAWASQAEALTLGVLDAQREHRLPWEALPPLSRAERVRPSWAACLPGVGRWVPQSGSGVTPGGQCARSLCKGPVALMEPLAGGNLLSKLSQKSS